MSAPVPGSWRRRVAIRGDGVAAGVVGVVVGLGLGLAGAAGATHAASVVVGAALALGGVVLVRRGRADWRALLAEVVRAHAGHDPGPSPVPWVADGPWRLRNGFDPALDAPSLLLRELDPGARAFGHDADGAFRDPVLRPVTPEERALAPMETVDHDAPVPEPGDAEALRARLIGTPGRFVAVAPRWPVCCGRPATLRADRASDRPARALFLRPDAGGPGDDDPLVGGAHAFQCRSCGRVYATDPAF